MRLDKLRLASSYFITIYSEMELNIWKALSDTAANASIM